MATSRGRLVGDGGQVSTAVPTPVRTGRLSVLPRTPRPGAVKWQRQYHAMLAAPLGPVDLVLGHAAYILVRIALSCAAFALVATLLGTLPSPLAVVGVLVAILCGAAHAPVIMAFSARQEN